MRNFFIKGSGTKGVKRSTGTGFTTCFAAAQRSMFAAISVFLMAVLLLSMTACNDFEPPKSKEVTYSIKLFSAFDSIGLNTEEIVINKDRSGYVQYYIRSSAITDEQLSKKVDSVNKNAYSDGDYQAGYRALYYQGHTTDGEGFLRVKMEFTDINFLKSEVNVMTLAEYLEANTGADELNHFTNFSGSSEVSLVKIEDKNKYNVVTVTSAKNQPPLTVKDSTVISYRGALVSSDKDTAKFSDSDFTVVFADNEFSPWIIIAAAALLIVFVSLIVLRFKSAANRRVYLPKR